jgi:hypothetical protein
MGQHGLVPMLVPEIGLGFGGLVVNLHERGLVVRGTKALNVTTKLYYGSFGSSL